MLSLIFSHVWFFLTRKHDGKGAPTAASLIFLIVICQLISIGINAAMTPLVIEQLRVVSNDPSLKVVDFIIRDVISGFFLSVLFYAIFKDKVYVFITHIAILAKALIIDMPVGLLIIAKMSGPAVLTATIVLNFYLLYCLIACVSKYQKQNESAK